MDILVDITTQDLPKLAEIYKNHTNLAPHVLSFINTTIKWKSVSKYENAMTFMSPNNCWVNDGTFLVLIQFHCYDVFLFTLEKSCENLYKSLKQTKRIDFNKKPLFFAVLNDHYPTIEKIITEKKFQLRPYPCFMYATRMETALEFEWQLPSDVYVKKLDLSHVPKINALWPHKYPGSENYLSDLITMNGGYGIFLKANNELVSWIIKHVLGHLGIVQTVEDYKKRGYGGLVTKMLSKEIAEEGHRPFGTIIVGNEASVNMFRKLGFQEIGRCVYVKVLDGK